jgi:MarR family transcriptional regulator for hemolysin
MAKFRDQFLTEESAVVGQLIVDVATLWRKVADQVLDEYGLSHSTARPLLALWLLGGEARQGVVAEEAGLEGPSIVRVIDLLLADCLVTRREDPSDRRAKIISLTDKGRERVGQIWEILSSLRGTLLSKVRDEDLSTTVAVLRNLEKSLNKAFERNK